VAILGLILLGNSMSTPPPSLVQAWLQPAKGAGKEATGLVYSQTVNHFLWLFCEGERTPLMVAQDMAAIWQKHGFIGVDELACRLLAQYHPHTEPAALNVLQATLKERFESTEPLTGYHRKQFAPLLAGLAHMFGVATGIPVTAVVGDLSNLGNTNAHFRNLIALRDGKAVSDVDMTQAEAMTDKAVRVACGLIEENLTDAGLKTKSFRFGGDETLILVFGATAEQVQPLLDNHAIPAVEAFAAKSALQDHEYGKEKFRHRSGFGKGMASYNLDANTRPALDPQKAEKAIDQRKAELGAGRRGRLGRIVLPTDDDPKSWLELAARTGYLKQHYENLEDARPELSARLTADGVLDTPSATAASTADLGNLLQHELSNHLFHRAALQKQHFHSLKAAADSLYTPQHAHLQPDPTENPYQLDPATATRLLGAFAAQITGPYARYLPASDPVDASEIPVVDLYASFQPPIAREVALFRAELAGQGITAEHLALERVLGVVNPLDPSTGGLLMGDVMPKVFGQFAKDTATLKEAGYLPEGAQAYVLAASMHNLAGANSLLGSQGANFLLFAFAQQVVLGSLGEMGFKEAGVIGGHRGGGNVLLAIAPMLERQDGTLVQVTPDLLDELRTTMHRRNKQLQDCTLGEFLGGHGFPLPDGVDPNMKIGEIPDRRRPEYPGLDLTTHVMPLITTGPDGRNWSGSRNFAAIVRESEDIIGQKRLARQQAFDSGLTGLKPS
jgi:hypothetical protein